MFIRHKIVLKFQMSMNNSTFVKVNKGRTCLPNVRSKVIKERAVLK